MKKITTLNLERGIIEIMKRKADENGISCSELVEAMINSTTDPEMNGPLNTMINNWRKQKKIFK